MRLQPVILGADFAAYAYIRCFWDAYRVKPIELGSDDIKSISRSKFSTYRTVAGLDRENVLLETLETLGSRLVEAGKLPFLVGCGDFYARIVSKNKPLLEQWYYVPYIDFDLLDTITQKENFYRICDEVGIPYPKTRFLDCADPAAQVDDSGFTYPLVAKPSNSAAYHYAEIPNKKKVFFVRDRAELEAIFGSLQSSGYDKSLIVQELIGGDDTQERILSIYTDANQDPIFAVGGRVVLQDHAPTAIGNPAVIIPERDQQVMDDAVTFMRRVGYHGMANFDVKYDAIDGRFKFFEINTRPGRSSLFPYLAGVNFAKVQVDDIVLHKHLDFVAGDRPFAYVTVPPQVVRDYVSDEAIRRQVLAAFKDGTACFALHWSKDSLCQRFWANVNYYHQIGKFRRYFQADEERRGA